MRIRFLPLLLLSLFISARVFGAASVDVRISAQEIFEGDTLTYEVHVKDLKGAPDLSAASADFEVASHGSQVQSNTFRMIVNGQDVSPEQSTTTVYSYGLTPKHAGTLTIPAPTVTVDGRKYAGQSVAVKVIAAEKQDIAILEILTNHEHVYPTQSFEVTLKIWIKPLPDNNVAEPLSVMTPPALTANWVGASAQDAIPDGLKPERDVSQWLNPYLHNNGRGFSLNGLRMNGMFMFDNQYAILSLDKTRERRNGADGQPIDYFVYTLKRTFTALKTGTFTFGPAKMRGTFAGGISGNREYIPRALLVTSPVKTVTCAMPEPRPANFNGCIGGFKLDASVNARDLRVGDPVTLKLDFERTDGNGPLDDVTAPDLSTNTALASNFTIVDKAPTGQVNERHKTFSYTLRPKKAGVSIPAITTSVFNLKNEKFEELSSEPVSLNVIESPQLRPDEISATPRATGSRISEHEKGVRQNITELSEFDRPAPNPFLYAGAVGVLWLAFGIFATTLTLHRRRAGDLVFQNRMRARSEAAAQLNTAREALKAGKSNDAALAAQAALRALLGYNSGVAPAGITPADARAILERCRVSKETSAETLRLLESIEAAEYGALAGMEAQAAVESAEKLVPQLQKELEAKR